MSIGASCKIACNSVSNLVMRVLLVVLMFFPQIHLYCKAYLGCDVGRVIGDAHVAVFGVCIRAPCVPCTVD